MMLLQDELIFVAIMLLLLMYMILQMGDGNSICFCQFCKLPRTDSVLHLCNPWSLNFNSGHPEGNRTMSIMLLDHFGQIGGGHLKYNLQNQQHCQPHQIIICPYYNNNESD